MAFFASFGWSIEKPFRMANTKSIPWSGSMSALFVLPRSFRVSVSEFVYNAGETFLEKTFWFSRKNSLMILLILFLLTAPLIPWMLMPSLFSFLLLGHEIRVKWLPRCRFPCRYTRLYSLGFLIRFVLGNFKRVRCIFSRAHHQKILHNEQVRFFLVCQDPDEARLLATRLAAMNGLYPFSFLRAQ